MTPRRLRSAVAAFGVLWLGLPPAAGAADEAPKAPASQTNAGAVMPGRTIAIEYTMSLEDGTRLGSNVGEAPYEFEVGAQNVLPGLDAAVVGMLPGVMRAAWLFLNHDPRMAQAWQQLPAMAIVGFIIGGLIGLVGAILDIIRYR